MNQRVIAFFREMLYTNPKMGKNQHVFLLWFCTACVKLLLLLRE